MTASAAGRRGRIHRAGYQIQRAGAGRRVDAADGLRLADRCDDFAGDGAASAAEHHCRRKKRVTIDLIQKRVSEHFNLREQDLKVRSNTRAIAFPRQVAMYIVKQLTTASLPEIGRQLAANTIRPCCTRSTR